MRNVINQLLLFFVLAFTVLTSVGASKEFRIFDAMLYKSINTYRDKGIPNAALHGIQTIEVMYDGNIWPDSQDKNHSPPEVNVLEESVKRVRKSIGPVNIDTICLDIEHWSLKESDNKKLTNNLNKYIKTIKSYKRKMPDMKFGYYGMLPVRNYYDALEDESSEKYIKWKLQNDKLKSLASEADIIFPSLYTFTSNGENWVKYAIKNIKEAKRYGKPVYAFIWPQYHPSVRFIGLNFMPAELWKLQLETVAKHADGVVIWGGWDHEINKQLHWDERAEWWLVLKNFAKSLPQ